MKKSGCIIKGILAIVLLAGSLGLGLFLARNVLANRLLTAYLSRGGFRAEIGAVQLHLLRTALVLEEVKIFNPPDWPQPEALYVRRLEADVRLRSWLGREQLWPRVELDIACVHLLTRPDGTANLDLYAKAFEEGDAGTDGEDGADDERDYRIGTFRLALDRMDMHDASQGTEPLVQTFDLDFDKTYHDLIDIQFIVDDFSRVLLARMLPALLGEEVETLAKDLRELGFGELLDGPAEVRVPDPDAPSRRTGDPEEHAYFDGLMEGL